MNVRAIRIFGVCGWLLGGAGLAAYVVTGLWLGLLDESGLRLWGAVAGFGAVLGALFGCLVCVDENSSPDDFTD